MCIISFAFCSRQHVVSWSNGGGGVHPTQPLSPKVNVANRMETSPERLRGATHDLFELLERVQCSRLDDQRCVLPAYFSQVSFLITTVLH